jgi:hypothetical protein
LGKAHGCSASYFGKLRACLLALHIDNGTFGTYDELKLFFILGDMVKTFLYVLYTS